MEIYALIGPSGTGKSYKALKVAYERDIEYVIDDGILIYKNKIVSGISAKNAKTKMEAVRRAIFDDFNHRNCVKSSIKNNKIDKILIIGTSKKMINTILQRLDLGGIKEEISIYDVASLEEIYEAKRARLEQGIHTVPLPTFEVKKHFSGLFRNPIKIFFKNKDSEIKEVEKTIIRPTFSYMGKYFISEKAIRQIIIYEISKFEEVKKINSIDTNHNQMGIEVNIELGMKETELLKKCKDIQFKILNTLESMTLLNILRINIHVTKFYQNK